MNKSKLKGQGKPRRRLLLCGRRFYTLNSFSKHNTLDWFLQATTLFAFSGPSLGKTHFIWIAKAQILIITQRRQLPRDSSKQLLPAAGKFFSASLDLHVVKL